MKQAPPKYYRNIIGEKFPDVRIAFTHSPMIGVTRIDSTPILEVLKASTDEYAEWYINGLENGTMATIIETPIGGQQYFAPGELFLKS
jgi:hypothetical protein